MSVTSLSTHRLLAPLFQFEELLTALFRRIDKSWLHHNTRIGCEHEEKVSQVLVPPFL